MKIPYRTTSIVMLSAFLLLIASAFFPHQKPVPVSAQDGAVAWDPCTAIVDYGGMHNLAALVSIGALGVFTIRGLRNRSGPRWLAIAGLLAVILVLEDGSSQRGCYGLASQFTSSVWFISLVLLLLHHAVQRRETEVWPRARAVRLASQCILLAFVTLLAAWFAFCQVVLIIGRSQPNVMGILIGSVQREIGLPALILFPFAVAIALYQIVAQPKPASAE